MIIGWVTVWDLYYNTNIYKWDKLQRRAGWWILTEYSRITSVASLLSSLTIHTLQQRCQLSIKVTKWLTMHCQFSFLHIIREPNFTPFESLHPATRISLFCFYFHLFFFLAFLFYLTYYAQDFARSFIILLKVKPYS